MTAPLYTPIATPTDMNSGALSFMLRGVSAAYQQSVMIRASRSVEARCGRRFAPFTVTESSTAEGASPFAAGGDTGVPMSMAGSLGLSRARSLGASSLVQDFWVSECAPLWPDLWVYSNLSVQLRHTWGDTQPLLGVHLIGPETDTGHVRLPIGTFCPVGTTIVATYSGGYIIGMPDDLVQAVKLQAAKSLIVEIEPENRPGMDTGDLEAEIIDLLAPYARA